MKATKRIKITFDTVNAGKYTAINSQELSESNRRIKSAMKIVVREYEKKETKSLRQASQLVLNA